MDEGERDKVIQSPNNDEINLKLEDQSISDTQTDKNHLETHQQFQHKSSIPFPSTPEKKLNLDSETEEIITQEYGRGHCYRQPKGAYKEMDKNSLMASVALSASLEVQNDPLDINHNTNETHELLPPDFALVGGLNSELKSLDEALSGPYAKEWKTALDYEIGQLEKLETWIVEDLPKGEPLIPCGIVFKMKRGPDRKIQSH